MPSPTPIDTRSAEEARPSASATPGPHLLHAVDVARALEVDPNVGLGADTVERRRRVHGPNRLAETPPRSRWAMALGVDPPARDTMSRPPRRPGDRILHGRRLRVLVGYGAVMAVGTLGVLAWATANSTEAHALSLAFTTFVMFQAFNVFNARAEDRTIFSRDLFTNNKLWAAVVGVVVLQVLAVTVDPFQAVFGTVDLDADDWLVAVGVASSIVWLDELRKLVGRHRRV